MPQAKKCVSGKKLFDTEALALLALIEFYRNNGNININGPKNVYHCDECAYWHFTSKGEFHLDLKNYLSSSEYQLRLKANKWISKFKDY